MSILGLLTGIGLATGVLVLWAGLRPGPPPAATAPTRRRRTSATTRPAWLTFTRQEKVIAALAAAAGLLYALAAGSVVAIVVMPIVAVGLRRLLTRTGQGDIARLEALEEWVRSLRGLLTTAVPLATAIVQTLPSAPEPLRQPLEQLVARIHAHRRLDESLYAFARDVDSQVGDFIAAALIQASRVSGAGLTRTLDGIATEVADEVRMRRDIAIEWDKVKTQARWLTIITVLLVGGMFFFTTLGEVYRSGAGSLIFLVLVALFGLCLRWIQARSRSKPAPRFLIQPGTTTPAGETSSPARIAQVAR